MLVLNKGSEHTRSLVLQPNRTAFLSFAGVGWTAINAATVFVYFAHLHLLRFLSAVDKFGQALLPVDGILQLLKGQFIVNDFEGFLETLVSGQTLADQLQMIDKQSRDGEEEHQGNESHQHVHHEIGD